MEKEKINLDLLEELTECWHTNLYKSNISLQDYLCLSNRQFQLFVTCPIKLKGEYYEERAH